MLNHTASRIVVVQTQSMTELSQDVALVYEWGCDGSAGQSTCKQRYSEACNQFKSDENLFAVCIVLMQLHTKNWYVL